MTRTLVSDGWHRVAPDCPISTDASPMDRTVDVVIGDRLGRDSAVILVFSDPATCDRLIEAAGSARARLAELVAAEG